jgi:hypothetical protein
MAYEYSFNETTFGDPRWRRETYALIQESFKLLLTEIQQWNSRALEHGASRKPYEQEEEDIARIIEWGEEKLADSSRLDIVIHSISVGSMQYIKAALLLAIKRKEEDVAQKAAEGWPDGVISALRESIDNLKKLAKKFKYPPSNMLWELIPKSLSTQEIDMSNESSALMEWDVFICHASEDKKEFVRELANALVDIGLKVWYDEFTLKVGDSLRRSIDRGLAHSRYGIVIISPAFLRKEWPQKELDGLVGFEVNGRKVILPVWHEIDVDEVRKYSPTLADRIATSSTKGIKQVVADLLDAMR